MFNINTVYLEARLIGVGYRDAQAGFQFLTFTYRFQYLFVYFLLRPLPILVFGLSFTSFDNHQQTSVSVTKRSAGPMQDYAKSYRDDFHQPWWWSGSVGQVVARIITQHEAEGSRLNPSSCEGHATLT